MKRTDIIDEAAISPLAGLIAASPRFVASDPAQERLPFFNGLETDAMSFIEDAAFHLCAADEEYWAAAQRFEEAIMPRVIDYILDALDLLGVTDDAVKAEVCRCVIMGGTLFDGKGFMEFRGVIDHLERAA